MRDIWFGDHRDLVKWSVLFRLAERYECDRILQIAYYRTEKFGGIQIAGEESDLPKEVTDFFRRIRNIEGIKSGPKISVFANLLEDRETYRKEVIAFLGRFPQEGCVVFLDPDTGLKPETGHGGLEHVSEEDAQAIFGKLKPNDVFVLYQHQDNRKGEEWIDRKRKQLAKTLGLENGDVKFAYGPKIAGDVALYFVPPSKQTP